jgi:hypothetical protein
MRATASAVPGRHDGDVEALGRHLAVEVGEQRPDVGAALGQGVVADAAAGKEAVREADGTDLEAARGKRASALAEQDLGAAAADVRQQEPVFEDRAAPAARRGG